MNRFQSFKLAIAPEARFTARPVRDPKQTRKEKTRDLLEEMRRKLQEQSKTGVSR